jgi:RimJ/RimL family protein N-acetyltransferase
MTSMFDHRHIETERLALRPPTVDDFAEVAAMRREPEVVRFIGGTPASPEESWARLLRYAGHWALLGYGTWIVRERGTARYVGDVGFANLRRSIEPPIGDCPEAGWVLASWAHGRRFATEAVHAIHAWFDEHLRQRTACVIDVANAASLRIAASAGYQEWYRTAYKGSPVIVFERPASS